MVPTVNSNLLFSNNNIDVHPHLSRYLPSTIYHKEYIQLIDESITAIVIPDWTCNDIDYSVFDFSHFTRVESIIIGNHCFGSVNTFNIDGLNRLKTIKIGMNSFTYVNGSDWDISINNVYSRANDKWKSFHILNCESLESIQIGKYSFNEFGGEFELKNLPQLRSIQFDGYNFYYRSFVIRGIDMTLNT